MQVFPRQFVGFHLFHHILKIKTKMLQYDVMSTTTYLLRILHNSCNRNECTFRRNVSYYKPQKTPDTWKISLEETPYCSKKFFATAPKTVEAPYSFKELSPATPNAVEGFTASLHELQISITNLPLLRRPQVEELFELCSVLNITK